MEWQRILSYMTGIGSRGWPGKVGRVEEGRADVRVR